jgi:chromosome segregation ATPase
VEEMRKQELEELQGQLSKIQSQHKQEIEQRDAIIAEAAHTAQVKNKEQLVLEEKFKILQQQVQRYEIDCATAQDKSCALQELVGDLKRKLSETEKQNITLQQSLAVVKEERNELDRTVRQLRLQMHQIKNEAGDSLDELRELVEEQKELTGKWKQECKLLANQIKGSSARLQEQHQSEISTLREEIDNLEKKFTESRSQCVRHKTVHREMQQLLTDTDQRAVTSQKQASRPTYAFIE